VEKPQDENPKTSKTDRQMNLLRKRVSQALKSCPKGMHPLKWLINANKAQDQSEDDAKKD